jgi:hypothetical protein
MRQARRGTCGQITRFNRTEPLPKLPKICPHALVERLEFLALSWEEIMTRILYDAALKEKLPNLDEPIELCDEEGHVLARI